MKKLLIAMALITSPACAEESMMHNWDDLYKQGEAEIYRGITAPVTPGPMASSPEYQPGYDSLHRYTYSDEHGNARSVWMRRMD